MKAKLEDFQEKPNKTKKNLPDYFYGSQIKKIQRKTK